MVFKYNKKIHKTPMFIEKRVKACWKVKISMFIGVVRVSGLFLHFEKKTKNIFQSFAGKSIEVFASIRF